MGTTQVILSTFGDHFMQRHETVRGFAIGPVPAYAAGRGLVDFVWNEEPVFHMPALSDGPSPYETAIARQAVQLAAYDMALDRALGSTWPMEQFDARWISRALEFCRPMVPTSLIVAQLSELRADYEDMLSMLQTGLSYADQIALVKDTKADVAMHGLHVGSAVDRLQQYREALLARLPIIQAWAKVLCQPVALCVEDSHVGLQQIAVLAEFLRTYTSLSLIVEGEGLNDEAGEDATPAVARVLHSAEDAAEEAERRPWRHFVTPAANDVVTKDRSYDLSQAPVTVFDSHEFNSAFGEVRTVAESSPLWLEIEENGLQPGLQLLDLPEPEPMPSLPLTADEQASLQAALDQRGWAGGSVSVTALVTLMREVLPVRHHEALNAFVDVHAAWEAREQEKAQRLSLDLVQERLNAPSRRILDRRAAARRHPAARVLVTRALSTPQAPHQELLLAGLLLPSHGVQVTDDAVDVANWLSQVAADPELFHEFTQDPEAPVHMAGIGLTTDSVLPTQELTRLSDTLEFAVVHEAGEALWTSHGNEARMHAAIVKIAADRGLDATLLWDYVRTEVQPKWQRHERLYSALGIAFVTGQSQGMQWRTKMRMDGQRDWIRPWIQAVAAVAYHVQTAAHWKARALAFGDLSPAEAAGIWTRLSFFEQEFIRIRIHSVFTYTSAALGANRLTSSLPLGHAVLRARDLARTRRAARPESRMTSSSPVMC